MTSSAVTVILIDDNNYSQSMRYEYYQLARKYSVGFQQLYIQFYSQSRHNNDIEDSFDLIHTVIEAATNNPAQEIVPNVSEEEREKDRVACDASVIYQADNCLRSFVNKRMFAMKQSGLGKDEMNAAGKCTMYVFIK